MQSIDDLKDFLHQRNMRVVIAADGQTRTHKTKQGRIVEEVPAGGVSVAFDRVSQALGATYVGRARTHEDLQVTDDRNTVKAQGEGGAYTLKRVGVSQRELDRYYRGFANQSLWPLFHIAYERPTFNSDWYEGYRTVARRFARAIESETRGRTLVWVNDYQLALVPWFLPQRPDLTVAFFWHIPWPSWDVLRILPQRQDILQSLLSCDFLGFQTEDDQSNFLQTVDKEIECRIDEDTATVHIDGRVVATGTLPIGVDAAAIRQSVKLYRQEQVVPARPVASSRSTEKDRLRQLCDKYTVLLGVDRLDYIKGIKERLLALDRFFAENERYRGRAVYIGIMAPTREGIPAYRKLKREVQDLAAEINEKYAEDGWQPLHMMYGGLSQPEILHLYADADACLVTSLGEGMNLVAKEFVMATSCSETPGMLVLSELAGAAADMTDAVMVNPYDMDSLVQGIREALEMSPDERRDRSSRMADRLERENLYVWVESFIRRAVVADRLRAHRVA